MVRELKPIDISETTDLLQLAETVRANNESYLLRRDSEDLAVLMPPRTRRQPDRRSRPVAEDDALFELVGIGKSGIPGGISAKKHTYLLRAKRGR